MEYQSPYYNGPLEIGDEVTIMVALESLDWTFPDGNVAILKMNRLSPGKISIVKDNGNFQVHSPELGVCCLAQKFEQGEHAFVVFRKKIKKQENVTERKDTFDLKSFLYGRQIRQEEQSLPPEEKRPFKFL